MPKRSRGTPATMPLTIEGWLEQVRTGALTRRRFLVKLSLVGASVGGASLLLAHALSPQQHAAANPTTPAPQSQNQQLHKDHVARQSSPPLPGGDIPNTGADARATLPPALAQHLDAILNDYHPEAVVVDTLAGAPIQGHAAIAERKLAEMRSIAEPKIEVTRRYALGDQVIAEWTFTGIHSGHFKGYAPTGNSVSLQGLTVVERHDGKIVKETLYYDAADVHRQLSSEA